MVKTVTYRDVDGYSIWEFNTEVNPYGPISVTDFPNEERNLDGEEETVKVTSRNQDHLPATKRQYYNPANGKMVGYVRAKVLKLI